MSGRRRLGTIAGLLGATLLVVLLAPPVTSWLEAPRPLPRIVKLLHDARQDAQLKQAAEKELSRYLKRHPDSREANMLMAQVLIDRNNPKPKDALTHLERIRSRDAGTRSLVLVTQGKALYQLSRLREAEAAWREALKLNPDVPEAGWLLIQQYYLQGRNDLCRELALSLAPRETDRLDRVRYVLELVREDVERLAPAGIIPWLTPAVKNDPDDRASVLALGRALVKEGRGTEGFALLRRAVEMEPGDPLGWEVLLSGLQDEGQLDALADELGKLPAPIAAQPRFAFFRGRLAQEKLDHAQAVQAYEEYLRIRPEDTKVLYRLARVLRLAGRSDEARAVEQREADLTAAANELKTLYQTVKSRKQAPDVADFQQFAAIRERQGRRDEARAWHALVLDIQPDNLESRVATARLSTTATRPGTPDS